MVDAGFTTETVQPGVSWRFWSLSLGGLLLVVLLLPAVVGIFAERLIYQKIEQINRNSPLQVTVAYYQPGWLSSRMLSQVTVPGLGIRANFSHQITHGPLSIRELSRGKASLRLATVITQPLKGTSGVKTDRAAGSRLTSSIDFDGNIATVAAPFSRPPSTHSSNGWMLQTDALAGEANWRPQTSAFNGWTRLGLAQLVNKQHQFAFTDVFARAYALSGSTVSNADVHVTIGEMSYLGDSRQFASVGNRLRLTSGGDRGDTNLRMQGTVSRFRWRGGEVTDVEFDVTLRATHSATVDSVAAGASEDESESAGHADPLLSRFRALLRYLPSNSELEVANLTFLHQDREVSGWLRVNSPAMLANSGVAAPEALLDNLTLKAELVVDESLVFDLLERRTRDIINRTEQFGAMETFSDEEAAPLVTNSVESQLAVLERQRYLDRQGGYYSTRIAFHDGRATVNDKPLMLRSFMR